MCTRNRFAVVLLLVGVSLGFSVETARAQDRLCDPGGEDCRIILLNLIRNETVGIDVAFWFMEDARYSNELVKKHAEGVPVRVLMDPRANSTYALNSQRLAELQAAGIPMRKRVANGILHWKMMLFEGQGTVEFSGANYSANAWRPEGTVPYANYTDEVIYFTTDQSVVNSFRTKYDDLWTNTTSYANYANVTGALVRNYDTFTKNPELNFPPTESFASRSTSRYNAENTKIDVIMYRITDRRHSDAMIAARGRGVPVRLISEPEQYRDASRLWHSWNVDRLYMAGVQIKHRAHAGLNHQKSVLLYGLGLSIFGSSNWTSPSSSSQEEHNYFTAKPFIFDWLVDQFERKWNNTGGVVETTNFVPLPPDRAITPSPAHLATGVATTGVKLTWFGGPFAHKYDIYFGTTPTPPLLVSDLALGPSESSRQMQSYTIPTTLGTGTTYYWRVVSKTMANMTKASEVWTFTTAGTAAPPPAGGSAGVGDVVLYAGKATVRSGAWQPVSDASAAGGLRMTNPNAGAAKLTSAAASPANYFEMSFTAEAGKPYRLWIRGRAESNHYSNDSIFIQFSGSATSSGTATWRIGTTSATEMNLEDCSGCGLSGWGWQDNGWGTNVLGPLVYFATSGTQTIRVQTREDGLQIDQIVLSKGAFLSSAPGAVKDDNTILNEQGGSASSDDGDPPPPSTSSPDVVLYSADAPVITGTWGVTSDATAAGGASLRQPNAGAAKVTTAAANPANYFELTFSAAANTPYRLWIRSKADDNNWANDSVFIQFSGSVTQSGTAIYRIGTTSAAESNLEDCSGCGLSGWGWQDNGWGTGVLGPLIYFGASGTQRIRIQQREDGVAIDQIVLSPSTWLNSAPGSLKNDTTIVQK
jgi:phosphatidylserine/phosphatidylglycerophosphate/cardiolipin synthase-like enzyme